MINIHHEKMAKFFDKFHIEGLPRGAVLHRFSGVDNGDPHDHPWPFTSFIISGGYTERVYDLRTGQNWLMWRMPGESHEVPAGHVHRIVHLHDEECWTLILPRMAERKSGFYRIEADGYRHRFWDQPEFGEFVPYDVGNEWV